MDRENRYSICWMRIPSPVACDTVKILWADDLCLFTKRLEEGQFICRKVSITRSQLAILLDKLVRLVSLSMLKPSVRKTRNGVWLKRWRPC